MKVEVDQNAGFCFGVVRAIEEAETLLQEQKALYCLGQMVHNEEELKRLEALGLVVVSKEDFDRLDGERVLIRAHGEPPTTYQKAQKHHIEIVDSTCPIVLKLQERIKKLKDTDAQIVLYGKPSHPEVIGLNGQVNNRCVIIEKMEDLTQIDFSREVYLFSQTTMDADMYVMLKEEIAHRMHAGVAFHDNNTICGQMKNRKPKLKAFAKSKDVVVFVAGKNSSNGKFLFSVAHQENEKTYLVSNPEEVKKEWFYGVESVGVSGATSTPQWLMEKIAERIQNI